MVKSNTCDDEVVTFTNVIAAKDISDNLLSLRKLADAGFKIHLDDNNFRVYDKKFDRIIIEGSYEKPNWIVRFEVQNNSQNKLEKKFQTYRCRARMISQDELPEQSQTSRRPT